MTSPSAVEAVTSLVHRLRAAGVPVSTGETIDAVTALSVAGVGDRAAVRTALRLTLIKSAGHTEVFERLFDVVFPAARDVAADLGEPRDPDAFRDALAEALKRGDDVTGLAEEAVTRWAGIGDASGTERHHLQRVLRRLDLARLMQAMWDDSLLDESADDFERRLAAAEASSRIAELRTLLEALVRQSLGGAIEPPRSPDDIVFLRASPDEMARLRTTVRPLARRIASRLGRRRRRGRGSLDMRRTIRASIGTGGVPLSPAMRRRRPSRPDLVVLCDVSGSVAPFATFTLALLHALHAEFHRIRSFVFVDGIVEITDLLVAAPGVIDVHRLLGRRGLVAGDGRSDYRRALRRFRERWPGAVTAKTTVLVVGDARSHGHPPASGETAELRRAARRLYWFNPEPRREWNTGDSVMSAYDAHCTLVFEVSSLSQLESAVTRIT